MTCRDRSGYALVALVLIGVAVGLGALFVWSWVKFKDAKSIVPVPPIACHCPDIADIRNRIAEATAAAAKYSQMINAITTSDAAAGKPTMFSEDRWKQGEDAAQADVNAAYTPGTKSGKGKTGTDCVTTVESASACIRASLQTHENVHAASCEAAKAAGRTANVGDYKAAMTMADYWREEVIAYTEELTYLSNNLAQAMAEAGCNPPVAVKQETYPGRQNKDEMKERLAGAWRRVSAYARGII